MASTPARSSLFSVRGPKVGIASCCLHTLTQLNSRFCAVQIQILGGFPAFTSLQAQMRLELLESENAQPWSPGCLALTMFLCHFEQLESSILPTLWVSYDGRPGSGTNISPGLMAAVLGTFLPRAPQMAFE